jgi:hypothetical protein
MLIAAPFAAKAAILAKPAPEAFEWETFDKSLPLLVPQFYDGDIMALYFGATSMLYGASPRSKFRITNVDAGEIVVEGM